MKLDIVMHTLGLDERHHEPYRNRYVTCDADVDMDELVAAGLMEPTRRPGFLAVDDCVFRATPAGESAARVERARLYPRKSRAGRRYDHWLDVADALGVSFGEYLRQGLYRERGL